MKERKSGCSVFSWVFFELIATTAFFVLLLLKLAKAAEVTWLVVFMPLIVGSLFPVAVLVVAFTISVIEEMSKRDKD